MNGNDPVDVLGCPEAGAWRAFCLGCLSDRALQNLAEHLQQCVTCTGALRQLPCPTDDFVDGLRRLAHSDYADEPLCHQAVQRLRLLDPLADQRGPGPSGILAWAFPSLEDSHVPRSPEQER
jgi:hypothetical protein